MSFVCIIQIFSSIVYTFHTYTSLPLSPMKKLSYILVLQTITHVQTVTVYDYRTGTHKQII